MTWQTNPADLAHLYAAGSQQDPAYEKPCKDCRQPEEHADWCAYYWRSEAIARRQREAA